MPKWWQYIDVRLPKPLRIDEQTPLYKPLTRRIPPRIKKGKVK